MSYLHIKNLSKFPVILLFKECYALEKIHGTSAHVSFNPADNSIRYFGGNEPHAKFVALFNEEKLLATFKDMHLPMEKRITVFGEAYGGSQQGMSHTYGKDLKFIAFDVKIGDCWLDVPAADSIATALRLEFVQYHKVKTDLNILDALRDAPSMQAVRNGISKITTINEQGDIRIDNPRPKEGIVLHPLKEMTLNNGQRVIAKYKGAAFAETKTPREVEIDPEKLVKMEEAEAIADEWVTHNRLANVLSHLGCEHSKKSIPLVLEAMLEDVLRESEDEIDLTKDEVRIKKTIKSKCAELYLEFLKNREVKHEI